MAELISQSLLERTANTVADAGVDFDMVTTVMCKYAAMNLVAYIYENNLCLADFPTPDEFVSSFDFTRRVNDVENRISSTVFFMLREQLVSRRHNVDFNIANMDIVLEAMHDIVTEQEEDIKQLEDIWNLTIDAKEEDVE